MKAERRHELQHNALDGELGTIISYIRTHAGSMLWSLAIAALVFAVGPFAVNHFRNRLPKLQSRFNQAMGDTSLTLDDRLAMLEEISQQDLDRSLAALAVVRMGDALVLDAAMGLSEAPGEAVRKADESYQRVLVEFSDQPQAVAIARIGLATLAENRGEFDVARMHYDAVVDLPGAQGTPAAMRARQNLQDLSDVAESIDIPMEIPAPVPDAAAPGPGDPFALPEFDAMPEPVDSSPE